MDYYTEFNMVDRTMTITPTDTSEKFDITTGSRPETILGLDVWTVVWISLGMATVATLFILLCLAVCCDCGPFHSSKASRRSAKTESNVQEQTTLKELETLLENALLRK